MYQSRADSQMMGPKPRSPETSSSRRGHRACLGVACLAWAKLPGLLRTAIGIQFTVRYGTGYQRSYS